MTYQELLEQAPAHDTVEFIDYLRANNKVFWENNQWIVIENFKYHKPDSPWYTAFYKDPRPDETLWYDDIDILWYEFGDYEWLKKSASEQTVKRFHIHLIKE